MNKKISVIAKNHIGSHYRVYSLLNKKGYSIDEAEARPLAGNSSYVRMVFSLDGGEDYLEQARRYLSKLIDVVEVEIIESKSQAK